jgi:hypothetical protein
MLGINVDRKTLKQYALIALAFLAISLIFFWPVVRNVTSTVPGTGADTFQSMWELWWVPYSMFTLHSNPYFSHYLFFPIGANLATQTLTPIAGLISLLFQPVNLAFALNMIFLLGFVLAGLFTYMLAFHVTKNRAASFIAGCIYAFSPIHTIQAFGHLQFTNIEFIPLFMLMLLYMIDEKKPVYAVCAGLSFVLLTFMGDIEQGLMAVLLAFFVLAYLAIDKKHRHKVLNKKFAVSFAEMLVTILVVGSPFILGVLFSLGHGALSTFNSQATTQYNELYSPDLFSFFVPSEFNGPLRFLSSGFYSIFAPAASERTTYIGYSVIFLVLAGLVHEYKDRFKSTGVYLVPLVLFGLLSIGPYLQINGNLTFVPGLYVLYHQIPLFNVLREPGRFDMMVELFLAIFAAMGLVRLGSALSSSSLKKYVPILFFALVMLEYNPLPISQSMLSGMYALNTTIPNAYYQMGALKENFSVMILPTIPDYTSQQVDLYPGMALYYQTAFKKPLVGGYVPRFNTSQLFTLFDMPLAVSSYYLQNGLGLVYGSPLQEDYANVTDFFLSAYDVGFVSVIGQAYNQTDKQQLAAYLTGLLGSPIYQSNDTMVFPTSKVASTAGASILDFTPVLGESQYSIWQPGRVLCGTSSLCNADELGAWFGTSAAYIEIYSPNSTAANISFRALSPSSTAQEYVYLDNQPLSTLNLTTSLQNFTFSTDLSHGISYLFFFPTGSNQNSTYPIGLENFTVQRHS